MTQAEDGKQPVLLHAAGSLRAAARHLISSFQADHGIAVEATFGPAGLLRRRIERGEPCEIFASANMAHPKRLSILGQFEEPICFARNRICVIARAELGLTTDNLIERLLDPSVQLGTSTPVADPSGDYALEVFEKIDAIVPGAAAVLRNKALHLVGGTQSNAVPAGRIPAEWLIATRAADVFLGYWSSASPLRDDAQLTILELPPACAVAADYGVAVSKEASDGARLMLSYILSDAAQKILDRHGFQRQA